MNASSNNYAAALHAILSVTFTVFALRPSAASAVDERLVSHLYDSTEIVRIQGRLGVQATIGFSEKESIENVAIGDAESWQITPNKRADLLFVKPLSANARTNMTVVTDKHTYFFDLVASPATKPVYMLRFTYKDEPKPASAMALDSAKQPTFAGDLSSDSADPALINFGWVQKGDREILPARLYDDGNQTYLLWADKQRLPAILMLNDKGEEGPVNYAVRGATIVIDDVPNKIVLRMGKKSATLSRQYSDKLLSGTISSTSSPATMTGLQPFASAANSSSPSDARQARMCHEKPTFLGGPYGDRRPINHAKC